jgi:hypothetical protein
MIISAKSAKTSSPSQGIKPSQQQHNHQVRRPPYNSSGNIAPLERVRSPPVPRENEEESKLPALEQEKDDEENAREYEILTTNTALCTQLMSLNALPIDMLSPALSNKTFQSQQQQEQQLQLQQPLVFPGADSSQITELIVGRLALCGLFGSGIVYMFNGQTLPEQIVAYPDNIILVTLAVLSASLALVEKTKEEREEGNKYGIKLQYLPALSSLGVEKWIGRLAMLGFSSILAWQLLFTSSS